MTRDDLLFCLRVIPIAVGVVFGVWIALVWWFTA